MNRLGEISVGNDNPVRIMGILNVSPESFHKKSIKLTNLQIRDAATQMESDGADFIDVGGMSTAPYMSHMVSKKMETERILHAINIIQSASNLPISVDTCRASVAKIALENGVGIINDISGLKFDRDMCNVVSQFKPSLILCAYSTKIITSNPIKSVQELLAKSINMAKKCGVPLNRITQDPAIGFFRKSGKGKLYTKIKSDWADRDVLILRHLKSIRQRRPILVSVSNKSFLGKILNRETSEERLFGSIAAETAAVLYGADIIRTHNVAQTRDAISVASKISGRKGL